MRVTRIEVIGILSGLLALGTASGGFAQTDGYDSSGNAGSPRAEWRQKVLKQAATGWRRAGGGNARDRRSNDKTGIARAVAGRQRGDDRQRGHAC